LGIYWNNLHHMLHATERVNGAILWANLHLLFWLSLVPFATGWMEGSGFASLPVAAYGIVLLLSGGAYTILQTAIVRNEGSRSRLRGAVGRDFKGKVSLVGYVMAIPLAFLESRLSLGIYVAVALLWFVPDRRIESVLGD